jgi:hypothetical protein
LASILVEAEDMFEALQVARKQMSGMRDDDDLSGHPLQKISHHMLHTGMEIRCRLIKKDYSARTLVEKRRQHQSFP